MKTSQAREFSGDKTPAFLKDRVLFTQHKVWNQLMVAQDISVKAHEAIRLAAEYQGEKPADYEDMMIEARQWCRKGQFFWDYVSAENSVGFHNPAKAIDNLALSQQYSQKAVDAAMRATSFAIAPNIDGDIKAIVPPILYHSREFQMDPDHMKSHPWFQYLPITPKADKIWEGNQRIVRQ